MLRTFKVRFFRRLDGVEWFDVKMYVTHPEIICEFTKKPECNVYEVLNSSSPEEFDRFIETLKAARDYPEGVLYGKT